MNEFEACVDRIKGLLARARSCTPEEVEGLCADYNRHCEEANTRLDQIAGCLKQGQGAQAIHLAETHPPVLEMIAALDFDGADAWRQLAREKGLSVAPAFESTRIQALEEAYGRNEALEPLQKSYRRLAAKNAPVAEKIAVLRRIQAVDATNPVWREDLGQLEAIRFRDIARILESEGERLSEIEASALVAELTDPRLAVKPAERILQKARELHESKRLLRVHAELSEKVRALGEAHAAMDFETTAGLFEDLNAFTAREEARVPDEMAPIVEDAGAWYAEKLEEMKQEAGFQRDLGELERLVDAGASAAAVQDRLRMVEQHGRDVPGGLLHRARGHLEKLAHEDAQKKRAKRLLIAGGVTLAVLLVALVAWRTVVSRQRSSVAAEIHRLTDSGSLDEAATYIDRLKSDDPGLLSDSGISSAVSAYERAAKEEAERRLAFTTLLKKGEEASPLSDSQTLWLVEAEGLAKTDAEKAKVAAWKAKVETAVLARAEEDAKLAEPHLRNASRKITDLAATDDPKTIQELLRDLEAEIGALAALKFLPKELNDSVRDFGKRAEAEKERLGKLERLERERSRQTAASREALRQAVEKLPKIAEYAKALTDAQERFPGTPEFEPERWADLVPAYIAVADHAQAMETLLNNAPSKDLPPYGDFKKWLDSQDIPDSPYSAVLKDEKARIEFLKNPQSAMESLSRLLDHDLFTKIHTFEVKDSNSGNSKTYYTDNTAKKSRINSRFEQITYFQDETLVSRSKHFDVQYYNIVSDPQLAPHGRLAAKVKSVLSEETTSPDWSSRVPGLIRACIEDKDSNPWPKAMLFRRAILFDKASGQVCQLTTELYNEAIGVMPDEKLLHFWLPDKPEVKSDLDALAKRMDALAPKLTRHLRTQELIRHARATGICRRVVISGAVKKTKDSGWDIERKRSRSYSEYWGIALGGDGLEFRILAIRDPGGQITWMKGERPIPGQPLLSPDDGKGSLDLFHGLGKDYEGLKAPSPWPANLSALKE